MPQRSASIAVPLSSGRAFLKLFLALMFVYLFLGLADLFLTWLLIQQGDGRMIESNPVAAWWLQKHGWAGMAFFKLGSVLAIGGLLGVIGLYRPRTSERLLVFGCGAQSAVVLYSVLLVFFVGAPEDSDLPVIGANGWGPIFPAEPEAKRLSGPVPFAMTPEYAMVMNRAAFPVLPPHLEAQRQALERGVPPDSLTFPLPPGLPKSDTTSDVQAGDEVQASSEQKNTTSGSSAEEKKAKPRSRKWTSVWGRLQG
jgi:hypothetical protein